VGQEEDGHECKMNRVCPNCSRQSEGFENFCSGCGIARKLEPQTTAPEGGTTKSGMPLWMAAFCVLGALAVLGIINSAIAPKEQSNQSAPPAPLSETEKLKIACQHLHRTLDNKPIAQLTRREISQLNACESLVDDAK